MVNVGDYGQVAYVVAAHIESIDIKSAANPVRISPRNMHCNGCQAGGVNVPAFAASHIPPPADLASNGLPRSASYDIQHRKQGKFYGAQVKFYGGQVL